MPQDSFDWIDEVVKDRDESTVIVDGWPDWASSTGGQEPQAASAIL